jgi:ketosteroid isomerase-like protein
MDQDEALADFARRWTRAELRGDTAALGTLLTDDFTAVGPQGFVRDKKQWIDRYASGALIHDAFTWEEVAVRRYGQAAVAVGVQGQQSVYEGRDADGYFRVTQVLVAQGGRWRLAALHLSPTGCRETREV